MDDCCRGGTQRHLQCAKLLQCFGGKLGALQDTPEGRQALKVIDDLSMEDVRKVVLVHIRLECWIGFRNAHNVMQVCKFENILCQPDSLCSNTF